MKGATGTSTTIWRDSGYYKRKAKKARQRKKQEAQMFKRRHERIDPLMAKAKSGCEESAKILQDKWGIKVIVPP